MKTLLEINQKIADLEVLLAKETEYSERWWAICNKIIALRWVVQPVGETKMSGCDFNQEGFCTLQCEYPDVEKCGKAKGKLQNCTAKEEDLTEFCEDCGEPIDDCGCGTCWILARGSHGKIVPVTPKEYKKLVEASN